MTGHRLQARGPPREGGAARCGPRRVGDPRASGPSASRPPTSSSLFTAPPPPFLAPSSLLAVESGHKLHKTSWLKPLMPPRRSQIGRSTRGYPALGQARRVLAGLFQAPAERWQVCGGASSGRQLGWGGAVTGSHDSLHPAGWPRCVLMVAGEGSEGKGLWRRGREGEPIGSAVPLARASRHTPNSSGGERHASPWAGELGRGRHPGKGWGAERLGNGVHLCGCPR